MRLRSLLFVPADSERKFGKATTIGADALILDLEDSVAPSRKAFARDAVRQLLNKKLIERSADVRDGRRLVLHLTDTGRKTYKKILASFVAREAAMLACLDQKERRAILALLDKIIDNSANWAKPY